MLIAIPYQNNEVFSHFGKTQEFVIYEIENKMVIKKEVVSTNGQGHSALGGFLSDHHVDIVICGGIGPGAVSFLQDAGIECFAGQSGPVDEVIKSFLNGTMSITCESNCNHTHHEGDCHHSCHK